MRPLPASLELPSRRVFVLEATDAARTADMSASGLLFAAPLRLLETGAVVLRAEGKAVVPGTLALSDFHALRAILTHCGWLPEQPTAIRCRNCGRPIDHRPCAALELGPFVDRELSDPELDTTLDLGVPHEIPPIKTSRHTARSVTLAPVTLEQARPLFVALARRKLRIDEDVVRAMGILALGDDPDPARVARALERCSDRAFAAIADAFLDAHYPPRLFSIARCPTCGARNDVDAPYDREFLPTNQGGEAPGSSRQRRDAVGRTKRHPFPAFEPFAEKARSIAETAFREKGASGIVLLVEAGVAACDEGGEPLLGSYVPAFEGDAGTPSRPPEITVFYRTFRTMWDEDGPYDWEEELKETIEHELAHHHAELTGHDPVDVEERATITREAERLVGKRASIRRLIVAFLVDLGEFLGRTWPIWFVLIAVCLLMAIAAR